MLTRGPPSRSRDVRTSRKRNPKPGNFRRLRCLPSDHDTLDRLGVGAQLQGREPQDLTNALQRGDRLVVSELEDLVVGNGSAAELQGNNATYTVTITPEASGTVTLDIRGRRGAGQRRQPERGGRPRGDSPMRLPFAVDSLACARVAIMLIPSYTAAAPWPRA